MGVISCGWKDGWMGVRDRAVWLSSTARCGCAQLFHSVRRGSHAAAPVCEFLSMHVKARLMTCDASDKFGGVEIHSPSARVPGFDRKGWGIPQAWPINTQHMPAFPRGRKLPRYLHQVKPRTNRQKMQGLQNLYS